jgi:hypothetical protein
VRERVIEGIERFATTGFALEIGVRFTIDSKSAALTILRVVARDSAYR